MVDSVDTISYESICLLWLTKHHVWTSESQRTERLSSLPDVIVLVVVVDGGGDESGHDGKCDPQYLRSGTSYRVATDRPTQRLYEVHSRRVQTIFQQTKTRTRITTTGGNGWRTTRVCVCGWVGFAGSTRERMNGFKFTRNSAFWYCVLLKR